MSAGIGIAVETGALPQLTPHEEYFHVKRHDQYHFSY